MLCKKCSTLLFLFFALVFEFFSLYNVVMKTNNTSNIFLQKNLIPAGTGIAIQLVPNNKTDLHQHPYYEIAYVVTGSLQHCLNDESQNLTEGDCYILTPNDKHSLYYVGASLHRDILISETLFEETLKLLSFPKEDFLSFISQPTLLHFSKSEIIDLENWAQQFTNTSDIIKKRCIGITMLLIILNKAFAQNETKSSGFSPIVKKILDYFNKKEIIRDGIPQLFRIIQYSPSYVSHTFKKEMGITLSEHLKNVRLTHIAYYLKTTNYSLREIADIVGIESLSYLNKIFKEKYGIPPIRYKKTHGNTVNDRKTLDAETTE